MADEVLNKGGLYLDEMTKRLRVLHPDNHQLTHELVSQCEEYLKSTRVFQQNAHGFIDLLKSMSESTDRERMEVIGKRSRLLMETSERNAAHERMEAILAEKEAQLERLKEYHDSLRRFEQEQEETILWLTKK